MKLLALLFAYLTLGIEPANAVGATPVAASSVLPMQINNTGRFLTTDGERAYWADLPAAPPSEIAIGTPVTGGIVQQILFVDSNGDLGQGDGLGNEFKFTPGAVASELVLHQYVDGDPANGTLTVNQYVDNNGSQQSQSELKHQTFDTGESLTTFTMTANNDDGDNLNGLAVKVGTAAANVQFDLIANDVSYPNAITLAGTGLVPTVDINGVLSIDNVTSAEVAGVSTHKAAINIGGTDYYILLIAA